MKVNISKLVDGCVEAHVTASSTKEATKQFRALIQHAYDLGVRDGKESSQAKQKGGVQKDAKGQGQKARSQEDQGKAEGQGIGQAAAASDGEGHSADGGIDPKELAARAVASL